MKAAVYARYSSVHQKENSIADQEAFCRKAAGRFDCTVIRVYADKEMSGSVSQRPQYQAMLAAAEAGEFEAIIAEDVDRLWRDEAEQHTALKLLRFLGVKVFVVSTGTDLTSEEGGIIASVTGFQSAAFLTNLKKKIRRGMEGRVREGFSCGGKTFAYRTESGKKVIVAGEAKIVLRIFKEYDGGMSPKAIAYRLNAEGVPAPNGRAWTWQTITGSRVRGAGILHNALYDGRYVWGRTHKERDPRTGKRVIRVVPQDDWQETKAEELRIVPHDLWERVQRRSLMQSKAPGHKVGRRPKYILSGLLKCTECGSNYIIRKAAADGSHWYGCGGHEDKGNAFCKNDRLVRRSSLERVVLDAVFNWTLWGPEVVEFIQRAVDKATAVPEGEARSSLMKRLKAARTKRDNIMAAIERGIITPTTKCRLEAVEAEVAELETASKRRAVKRPKVSVKAALADATRDLKATMEKDPEEARHLLAQMLKTITLRPARKGVMAELHRGNLVGWFLMADSSEDAIISVRGCEGSFRLQSRKVGNEMPEEGLEPPRA